MQLPYRIRNILNISEIRALSQIYYKNKSEKNHYKKFGTLNNVNRIQWYIEGTEVLKNTTGSTKIVKKINDVIKKENLEHYFVEYATGSWTNIHYDYEGGASVVTLLEANGLVGGETILVEHGEKKEDLIPTVPKFSVGQSLICSSQTLHGVSRIFSGTRLVLVSWYGDKNTRNRYGETPPGFVVKD